MSINLREVAEVCWRQLFPEGADKPPITKAEFISTSKMMYADEVWRLSKNERNQEGVFNVPSVLLSQTELTVEDNMVDISELSILRSLSNDSWLQNIGGIQCKCKYVKSNVNQSQLLCDDDGLPNDSKTYFVVGNKILFPRGTHKDKLPIIYANKGLEVDGKLEIDDALASSIRTRLIDLYGGKTGKEDVTENSNPQN